MNEIIELLMRRDGISQQEARGMYEDCKAEIYDAFNGTSVLEPDEILASELGLEPDYFIYFM